jgi:vacuolar-type H+-ATPase subunit E/Vma4
MSEQEDMLTREIRADAERRAGRVRQRAEREAGAVLDEARKEAAEAVQQAVERATARAERIESVGRARLEQQVAVQGLRRRKEVLDRVRAEARQQLVGLAEGEGYRDVLVDLAALAVEAMSGDRFEMVLRPPDRERWAQALPGAVADAVRARTGREVQLELSDETVEASGGLVVRGAGGRELADQTFEARLARLWPDIQSRVAPLVVDTPEDKP